MFRHCCRDVWGLGGQLRTSTTFSLQPLSLIFVFICSSKRKWRKCTTHCQGICPLCNPLVLLTLFSARLSLSISVRLSASLSLCLALCLSLALSVSLPVSPSLCLFLCMSLRSSSTFLYFSCFPFFLCFFNRFISPFFFFFYFLVLSFFFPLILSLKAHPRSHSFGCIKILTAFIFHLCITSQDFFPPLCFLSVDSGDSFRKW